MLVRHGQQGGIIPWRTQGFSPREPPMPTAQRTGGIERPDAIPPLRLIDHFDRTRTTGVSAPERFMLQRFHKSEMIASRILCHDRLQKGALRASAEEHCTLSPARQQPA